MNPPFICFMKRAFATGNGDRYQQSNEKTSYRRRGTKEAFTSTRTANSAAYAENAFSCSATLRLVLNEGNKLFERDLADARSAGGVDGVGDRGSHGGSRRFANAGWRHVDSLLLILPHHFRRRVLDIRVNLRRLMDTQDLVIVKIVLHDSAILHGDLAEEGVTQAVDDASLHLRHDAVAVDREAAVDHAVDVIDRDLVLVVDRNVGHDTHIAQKAAMDGDAQAAAL